MSFADLIPDIPNPPRWLEVGVAVLGFPCNCWACAADLLSGNLFTAVIHFAFTVFFFFQVSNLRLPASWREEKTSTDSLRELLGPCRQGTVAFDAEGKIKPPSRN